MSKRGHLKAGGKRVASKPTAPAEPRGTYTDSSGRVHGECPVCTEVVTVSPGGKVEPHAELVVVDGWPKLGAQCRASSKVFPELAGGGRS